MHLSPVFRNFNGKARSICKARICYFHPILGPGDSQKALEFHILLSGSMSGWVCLGLTVSGRMRVGNKVLGLNLAAPAAPVSVREPQRDMSWGSTSRNQLFCRADVEAGDQRSKLGRQRPAFTRCSRGRWILGEIRRPHRPEYHSSHFLLETVLRRGLGKGSDYKLF